MIPFHPRKKKKHGFGSLIVLPPEAAVFFGDTPKNLSV
jgi:hypothetical protein